MVKDGFQAISEEAQVILVDGQDNEIGLMGKLEAHRAGKLHRAISVFIFDCRERLLLQRRAANKYHSAGLWTNSCCSHPSPGETPQAAAERRLQEEMGLSIPLRFAFSFRYRAPLAEGLVEHEIDHVFIGYSDEEPLINPEEASGYRWLDLAAIHREVQDNPEGYTAWFKLIYERAFRYSRSGDAQ